MNETLIRDIERTFQAKGTDELLAIWRGEDREEYSHEAFEAVRRRTRRPHNGHVTPLPGMRWFESECPRKKGRADRDEAPIRQPRIRVLFRVAHLVLAG